MALGLVSALVLDLALGLRFDLGLGSRWACGVGFRLGFGFGLGLLPCLVAFAFFRAWACALALAWAGASVLGFGSRFVFFDPIPCLGLGLWLSLGPWFRSWALALP